MTTPRAQWKTRLVEKAMQIPQLEEILRHSRSSDFENWQRIILFAAFKKKPNPDSDRRAQLADEVELTPDQVTNWFRTRRKDETKQKLEAVYFTNFPLKGPTPTKKEKKELATKKNEKREKFLFDSTQIAILNGFFDQNPHPSKKDKEELREKLGNVEHKQITYWFANRRKRSEKYQEWHKQGKEEEDATDDEKPPQRYSCSAFPVRVRNILSEEFEKSSKLNSESTKRILKNTGLTKTQIQAWFYNERTRQAKKNVKKQPKTTKKKRPLTLECIEDEDGNMTIKLPADAFKEGAKVTIRQGKRILQLNPKRRKAQVKPKVESDDEEGDQAGSSSSARPSTSSHGYTTRKKTQVPSDSEETDDEEEKDQTPEFKTWSEYSKGNAKMTEQSPVPSENEATDEEEEDESSGTPEVTTTQHSYPTRNRHQVTSRKSQPKIIDRKNKKSDKKPERVISTRNNANVATEEPVPEEMDTSDVATSNSSVRTTRRSRRNQRTKTPDQSETIANFDDFNPSPALSPRSPSRSASHSPVPLGRREREDSNTPSDGTDMAGEPMDIDFDDFNHHNTPPQESPEPSETGEDAEISSEGTPDQDGMDLDDLSYISPPASPLHRDSVESRQDTGFEDIANIEDLSMNEIQERDSDGESEDVSDEEMDESEQDTSGDEDEDDSVDDHVGEKEDMELLNQRQIDDHSSRMFAHAYENSFYDCL